MEKGANSYDVEVARYNCDAEKSKSRKHIFRSIAAAAALTISTCSVGNDIVRHHRDAKEICMGGAHNALINNTNSTKKTEDTLRELEKYQEIIAMCIAMNSSEDTPKLRGSQEQVTSY